MSTIDIKELLGSASFSGISGYSGYSGTSGYSGISGYSGGGGASISNNPTTNASFFVTFANATSGTATSLFVANTALVFNPNTGSVGVGVAEPARQLHVRSVVAGGGTMRLDRDADSPVVLFARFPTGDYTSPYKVFSVGTSASANDVGVFFVNDLGQAVSGGTRRFTISATGNVGIGTAKTSPLASLDWSDTVSVISANTTAVASVTYVLTANLVLTLPASPNGGDWVKVSNRSTTVTCSLARNGQNIMGLAEDMTIDTLNAGFTTVFTDATRGWVIT